MPTRDQLTLFLPPPHGERVEAVRRVVDPVQHRLIPAHVTLCREDELTGLEVTTLAARLTAAPRLTLTFGPAERFDGHGILLPCLAGADAYHWLRCHALGRTDARRATAHITLAHPRNPEAPGNDLAAADGLGAGFVVTFGEAQLIRQEDGGPWVVLATLPLARQAPGVPHP